ncbi:hypothetical protein AB0365_09200, partial [Brevibacterium casei]
VRHDETSLPARSSEHQDDSHNDWTYIPGSAHKDLSYVRNFYTVESLREARVLFEQALRNGNKVLYSDGGAAIKRWYGDARQ